MSYKIPKDRKWFPAFVDFLGAQGAQRLSVHAQSMLVAVLCQWNGKNNGSLKITARTMPRWARWSRARQAARDELIEKRFLFLVTRGRRPNIASLYAVACYPLDDNPQHDSELVADFNSMAWRTAVSEPRSQKSESRKTPASLCSPGAQKRIRVLTQSIEGPRTVLTESTKGEISLCSPGAPFLDVYPSTGGMVGRKVAA